MDTREKIHDSFERLIRHTLGNGDFVVPLVGITFFVFAIYCAFSSVMHDNVITYCYTEYVKDDEFVVVGNIEWREDKRLGMAKTPEGAHELLLKICPVNISNTNSE